MTLGKSLMRTGVVVMPEGSPSRAASRHQVGVVSMQLR
ncbi:hypothetical protein BTZ20_2043 [Rhodococcus sp. MTM3W5.2]|nr:hypothetical protein BTZ20_2043 [Rhodococcus sp. MTM3W5.2]